MTCGTWSRACIEVGSSRHRRKASGNASLEESEGQYDVRGGGGNRYFGAYQMSAIDALADGATHMMLKEHKKILGEKRPLLMKQLRETPPNAWPPLYWQDAAFSTVYNWELPGSGARHWAGGRWHC